MNVYETCPEYSSDRFLLRQTKMEDCDDLLKVYSDINSVPLFNSDNCINSFYITTTEHMMQTIEFWQKEYQCQYYVRWSIIDRTTHYAVGTIELFNRSSEDFYNNMGLLRLDLRSDYENEALITEILSLFLPSAFALFSCDTIATKIPPCAFIRREALCAMGFRYSPEPLRGHHGTEYKDYYILEKNFLRLEN